MAQPYQPDHISTIYQPAKTAVLGPELASLAPPDSQPRHLPPGKARGIRWCPNPLAKLGTVSFTSNHVDLMDQWEFEWDKKLAN